MIIIMVKTTWIYLLKNKINVNQCFNIGIYFSKIIKI